MSTQDGSPHDPSSHSEQVQKLPPATPTYILRGHASAIHALDFYNANSRLVSGDADGWIVVWSLMTKRPAAAWKAHEGPILAVQAVDFRPIHHGSEIRVFTHGRDHRLRVWRLNPQDEDLLDKELPVDELANSRQGHEPWLIHSLSINALNFCAFALCVATEESKGQSPNLRKDFDSGQEPVSEQAGSTTFRPQIFLAVPNALDSGSADIFHLPSEKRVSTIPSGADTNTGMVMAMELFSALDGFLYLVSGYEDGSVMVHVRRAPVKFQDIIHDAIPSSWTWQKLYMSRPHSQPVLALDVAPTGKDYFLTSSADAIIAKHPIPEGFSDLGTRDSSKTESMPLKVLNTKHAGQQGLRIRSDGKIFATAGWDFRIRVYSCRTMKELAVLKWHKEGCYAVALADVNLEAGFTTSSRGVTKTAGNLDSDRTRQGIENMMLTKEGDLGGLAAIKEQRSRKAQLTHWLAAGSKDGKISLWDIY